MIYRCLRRNPDERPSAEELLNCSFIRKAKKNDYLSGKLRNIFHDQSEQKNENITSNHETSQTGVLSEENLAGWQFE